MGFIYLIFVQMIVVSNIFAAHLPSFIHTCSKSDPNFEECLKTSAEDAIVKLANGNQELGIISLEPLPISLINVGRSPGSAISIEQKFTNIKLYGLTQSKVNNVRINFDNCSVYFETFTPHLRSEADFEITGQLLIFPINGKGPSNVTMTNLSATHNISCERFMKKGLERIRATDYRINIKPEKIEYKFDNVLRAGNDRISQEIDKTINDNALLVFEEVRPATEMSYGLVFREITNRLFTKIPLNEIFRD